ncbi:MAG TPA: hypothetical protein VK600_00415 [Candidatus Saccharimonadales bacterium]|nr:hypothetical protein [Candidatus Saccharimonadales bacterium]
MSDVEVVIVGIPKAMRDLDPARMAVGLRTGFQAVGDQLVAPAARRIVRPHHWHGRFEQQIHTTVTGSGLNVAAHVGVSSAMVPEARPLTFGWKSGSGRQPPTDAIMAWLTGSGKGAQLLAQGGVGVRRNSGGFITGSRASRVGSGDQAAVRSIAFLIARKIGKSGYSFEPLHTFTKALAEVRGQIGPMLLHYLRGRP